MIDFNVIDTESAACAVDIIMPELNHVFKEYVKHHGWPETDLTKSDDFNAQVFFDSFFNFVRSQTGTIEFSDAEWSNGESDQQLSRQERHHERN